MERIGLQMYTLRKVTETPESFEKALEKAASIGYRFVQAKCPAYLTTAEYKALLDRYGLRVDTLRVNMDKMEAEIEKTVRDSEILGTGAVRVESMNAELAHSPEGFLKQAEMMEKNGAFMRKHGLRLWYHFHAFEFINFPNGNRGIDILLNNTSKENVWFQPDLFWLTAAGTEASDSIKMFAGRAVSVHVKDYQIIDRTGVMEHIPHAFAPVGCGNLNWKRIIPAVREISIDSFVVEQDECRDDPFACIETSYRNLRKMGIEG